MPWTAKIAMANLQPHRLLCHAPQAAKAITIDNSKKLKPDHGASSKRSWNAPGFIVQIAAIDEFGTSSVKLARRHIRVAKLKKLARARSVGERFRIGTQSGPFRCMAGGALKNRYLKDQNSKLIKYQSCSIKLGNYLGRRASAADVSAVSSSAKRRSYKYCQTSFLSCLNHVPKGKFVLD